MTIHTPRFLAIDFETANYFRDSACAVGLVRVENNVITERMVHLIRPPSQSFMFSYIHGITWEHVSAARTFGEIWPGIKGVFEEIDFLAAHNAAFDSGVLNACFSRYKLPMLKTPFLCSMSIARQYWNVYPTKLPDVCRYLKIDLNHHDALSDATACAKIIIASGAHLNRIDLDVTNDFTPKNFTQSDGIRPNKAPKSQRSSESAEH